MIMFRIYRMLNLILQHVISMEHKLSEIRDDFDAATAELGAAITDLANRIAGLPDSLDDLTQADLDAVKADTAALKSLAVASPVPTPDA
jgi:hypothetical protein